jgi:DNA-binding response OmpR family regulator
LLDLFCQNKNQLLPREEILEYVWGDEGVIVGRSVDVFVSRLRKKLKPDDNIKITSVHGVGYRLEIPEKNHPKTPEAEGLKFLLNDN